MIRRRPNIRRNGVKRPHVRSNPRRRNISYGRGRTRTCCGGR